MALPQSALSELLEAVRAGGDTDVLRDAMRLVLQELIELEASQAIGAGRYERTDERITHRNGSRSRLLSTKAGDVELRIPKFRAVWSTNPLERVNKEIKRRTDVVGIFPNETAVVRLAGAVLLEIHDEWAIADRRYLSEASMALLDRPIDDGLPKEVGRATTALLAS